MLFYCGSSSAVVVISTSLVYVSVLFSFVIVSQYCNMLGQEIFRVGQIKYQSIQQ